MEQLNELYYSPAGYQKGISAANKLHKLIPSLSKKQIQDWLDKQPIYQIYKAKPKSVKFPHYAIDKPNELHQVDLLYLPHDQKFKYALTVIDAASRYKEAQPLKTKKAAEVSEAIQKIYERSMLDYPKEIVSDYGLEFYGVFKADMEKHNVKLIKSLDKKKVAFVERFNRTLSEKLFAYQYNEEMLNHKTNKEWVDRLPHVIESLNNEETRMINMKPVEAIHLDSVPQPEYEEVDVDLPIDSIVRYLYKPGEEHNDKRYRATDAIWSVDPYLIDDIKSFDNQPSIYTLQGLGERTFTKEELQVISPDTENLNLFFSEENDGKDLSNSPISTPA